MQLKQLENELAVDKESLHNSESLSTDLMKEKALLEKTLETLRENSERQVHTHTHTDIPGLSLNQMVTILNKICYICLSPLVFEMMEQVTRLKLTCYRDYLF